MRQIKTKASSMTPFPKSLACRAGPFLQSVSHWSSFFHGFLCIPSNKGKPPSCPPSVSFHSSPQELPVSGSCFSRFTPVPFCSPEDPCGTHTAALRAAPSLWRLPPAPVNSSQENEHQQATLPLGYTFYLKQTKFYKTCSK